MPRGAQGRAPLPGRIRVRRAAPVGARSHWLDFHKTAFIDVRIESSRFGHAVRVDLFDKDGWQDEAYTVGRDGSVTLRGVRVSFEPAIIRLFAD